MRTRLVALLVVATALSLVTPSTVGATTTDASPTVTAGAVASSRPIRYAAPNVRRTSPPATRARTPAAPRRRGVTARMIARRSAAARSVTSVDRAAALVQEDGDFAHDVGCGPPVRCAGLAASEVEADRLPVEPGAVEE